jgi:hypothetical protein
MLTLDSWGGQTNSALYDEKLLDENNEPTYSLEYHQNVHHHVSFAKSTFTNT